MFDPPPTGLTVPWAYLVGVAVSVAATSAAVFVVGFHHSGRIGRTQLRDL